MKDVFDTYSTSVGTLLQYLPDIHKAAGIKDPLDKMPGWDAFLGRPRAFVERGGQPILVGTLFGPTGSGKSALFRNLTGIPVPSDLVRPTSYSCVVAAPEGVVNLNDVQSLFPNYRVAVMENPEVLRDPERGDDELFCAFYKPSQNNGSTVNLILADVPDFNSVDQGNWTRAEQMLARAEVVVFMTYAEAYKNERVVSYLVKACQNAGHLVYVLNKTPKENAAKIWEDLLKYAQGADRFAEKRHTDGLTLHEFLGKAAAYYLPFGGDTVPSLDKLTAIRDDSPTFSSLLTGLDAGKVILLSLMEVTPVGVATSRAILAEATNEKQRLHDIIQTTAQQISERAEWVAGTQFPIGRWVELVVEIAKQERPGFMKPLEVLSGILNKVFFGAVGMIRGLFSKQKEDIRPRKEIEEERLRGATQDLVEAWRSANADLVALGFLSAENCRKERDSFLKKELPAVGSEWDDFVKGKVLKWSREHRMLSGTVATLSDLLSIVGLAALTLDLCAGGMGGASLFTLHSLFAAGVATGTLGVFISAMKTLHLDGLLQEAYAEWGMTRKNEMQAHIQQQFADPLFINSVRERGAALQSAPIKECMDACAALEQLQQKFGKQT